MKDKLNREITYLRISVTDRCNLRCLYCMPNGIEKKSHDEILRDEEIVKIVTEAVKVGITKIRITGGEPLVRKGIYDLIKKINDVEGVKEVVITTNGLLLENNVKRLKEAGISRVNFSLDTLKSERFKQITNSNHILDYHKLLKELINNGLPNIKINTVLLRDFNTDEMDDFIDLADQYDITIRFIELMPVGHLDFDHKQYYIDSKEILNNHKKLEFVRRDNVTNYYKVKGRKGLIGFINPISHKFCSSCNRIRLTADKNLKPCLHNNNEIFIEDFSNDAVLEDLKRAINSKPKSHHLNEAGDNQSDRPMNKIGG